MRGLLLAKAITLLLLGQVYAADENCQIVRAGMDIGSGSTKMKVARVDVCHKKILEILKEDQAPVAYKEDLSRSKDKSFGPEILKQGGQKLKDLVQEARDLGAIEIFAVATSAFRDAKNASAATKAWQKELNLPIRIIPQRTEALLGHAAAAQHYPGKEGDLVAWDIGGGSQQIIALDEKGRPDIFEGKLASGGFKNLIIEQVQGKPLASTTTPNPISFIDMVKALNQAIAYVGKVPKKLREKIRRKGSFVVGIGGVHGNSIKEQLKFEDGHYTRDQLERSMRERLGMSDKDIGGSYADTDVSNLILVYGMMTELGIDSVEVQKVNLADALLISPELAGLHPTRH